MRVLIVLLYPVLSYADSLDFFFSANGSCPGIPWACVQNGVLCACGYDTIVDRYYCCGAVAQASCRTGSATCLGQNGGPSSIQHLCTSGEYTWCCLKNTEQCTRRPGQINVCDATAQDTIGNVSQQLLEDTFSSLSAANPQATTFSFDATSLSAIAAIPSTSSSTISSSTSSSSAAPTTTPAATGSSSSLSGGAIAGVVIGSVVGVVIILGLAYLAFRRRSSQKATINESTYTSNHSPDIQYAHQKNFQPVGPLEMGDMRAPQELHAERAHELHG